MPPSQKKTARAVPAKKFVRVAAAKKTPRAASAKGTPRPKKASPRADGTRTALILQGGAALGAYEAGVLRALVESGRRPDIVTGCSIGALMAAIVVASRGDPVETLRDMWQRFAMPVNPFLPSVFARSVPLPDGRNIYRPNPGWFALPTLATHLYDGARSQERVQTLDGKPREYLRLRTESNDEVHCLIPESRRVVIEHRSLDEPFPGLIGVPAAYLGGFVLHLPVYYVYLMVVLEEVAKAFVSGWRFRSRKWIHDLVNESV